MSQPLTIGPDDFDEILGNSFPEGFVAKRHNSKPLEQVVMSFGPIEQLHLDALAAHLESGKKLGVTNAPVAVLRASHHRMAQLLAGGMDEYKVAALCNRAVGTISILKQSPAFQDLMAHYAEIVDAEFADFISAASELRQDMLSALHEMLDSSPEKFGPGHLMDAIKLLADRTGHAPVTRTHNVNVNVDLGSRLRAARERANAQELLNITPAAGEG